MRAHRLGVGEGRAVMDIFEGFLWAILVVIVFLSWQGNLLKALALVAGHFILRLLRVDEKLKNEDRYGDVSVGIGYIFLGAIGYVGYLIFQWQLSRSW
jgi:hypothetical protein